VNFLATSSLLEQAFLIGTTPQKMKMKLDFWHNMAVVDQKVAKVILK